MALGGDRGGPMPTMRKLALLGERVRHLGPLALGFKMRLFI